jgi:putative component of toxin-antitoxin plasmid stabilization module
MPACNVLIYQKGKNDSPFVDWLNALANPSKSQNVDAAAQIRDRLARLAKEGHALRRPTSAPISDGIHELRVRVGRVNYRVLYFFAGSGTAVVAHGCTKEGDVDPNDISTAIEYKLKFEKSPTKHTYVPPAPSART